MTPASILGVLIALSSPLAARGEVRYTVVDLGTLGGFLSAAKDINSLGEVAGVSEQADSAFRAFRYDAGGLIDLGALPGETQSFGLAIDDAGRVVGASYRLGDVAARAFRAAPFAPIEDLGAFTPSGVNQQGDIVGMVRVASPDGWISQCPCLYSDGVLSQLPTLAGNTGRALDISDAGVVVGSCSLPASGVIHGVMWTAGAPVDLGTLGGPMSEARSVNSAGVAAGYAETASGFPHACLFAISGGGGVVRTDLGTLNGARSSYAYGINDEGVVVGVSDSRAFVYDDGQMRDLNTLIEPDAPWQLRSAEAINNSGQIVGTGVFGGVPHAFVLTPVDCAGDIDGSGAIDVDDLNAILSVFGTSVGVGDRRDAANNDGLVDVDDLNVILANFGASCP